MSLYKISRGFHTWGYVSGGWPWSYSGNDQEGSWPGAAEFARQYSKPQIFQAPASLITIASGEMFLWSILALSWRKARPSDTWRSPYLISISNILCERSCSGTGLGSWSWRRILGSKNILRSTWLPRTLARLAKTGSVAKARQSLLSSRGCWTVKILGCLSLVSCPTPFFIISQINSLSPFSNLSKRARSRTKTEAACFVDFFTAL